jgi:uroporphyrinogen decarboxylase
VDTRGIFLSGSDTWKNIELSANTYIDEWGVTYHQPENSPFYDALKNPLAGELTSKTLREYPWPDPHNKGRVRNVRERARYLRGHTDYAVVFHAMGGFITQSQYLRGLEQWLEDMAAEPDLLGELLDCTLNYQLNLTMDCLAECDFDVDIVHFGDDLGMQNGLMFSPKTYREIIKPRQAKLFATVKKNTKAKVFFHSCGSNYDILDDLIEIGVDAFNPVQTNAKNMQADKLKREFGGRLCFWGAVDTHVPSVGADPAGMEEEVKKVIEVMAPGGGYVLSAIHNIQPDISAENILTLFDSALKYGSQ